MTMTIYKTSDFLTATTLLLLKHPLITTDNTDQRRVVFEFQDSQRLQQNILQLNRGELLVDPADFWVAERRCKQLIHEGGRV